MDVREGRETKNFCGADNANVAVIGVGEREGGGSCEAAQNLFVFILASGKILLQKSYSPVSPTV